MANEIIGRAGYSVRSIPLLQYQWWWTAEDELLHPGIGVGLHVTPVSQSEFVADPSGTNTLLTSVGFFIRDGLDVNAFFGEEVIIGDPANAHTLIGSDHISMITEDGVSAIDITASAGTDYQKVQKTLVDEEYQIAPKTTKAFIILPADVSISADKKLKLEIGGKRYTSSTTMAAFTFGVSYSSKTQQSRNLNYTEYDMETGTDVTRHMTAAYDGDKTITIYNDSPDFPAALKSVEFWHETYVPATVINGDCTIGELELTELIQEPASKFEITNLTPASNPAKCNIFSPPSTQGGYMHAGKWVFVQMKLKIVETLAADKAWMLLQGFPRPLDNNVALSAAVSGKDGGYLSAHINQNGILRIYTGSTALDVNDIVVLTGWYVKSN